MVLKWIFWVGGVRMKTAGKLILQLVAVKHWGRKRAQRDDMFEDGLLILTPSDVSSLLWKFLILLWLKVKMHLTTTALLHHKSLLRIKQTCNILTIYGGFSFFRCSRLLPAGFWSRLSSVSQPPLCKTSPQVLEFLWLWRPASPGCPVSLLSSAVSEGNLEAPSLLQKQKIHLISLHHMSTCLLCKSLTRMKIFFQGRLKNNKCLQSENPQKLSLRVIKVKWIWP